MSLISGNGAKHGCVAVPATPEVVAGDPAAAGQDYAVLTLRRRVAASAGASGVARHHGTPCYQQICNTGAEVPPAPFFALARTIGGSCCTAQ
jgi:hypothetical protein